MTTTPGRRDKPAYADFYTELPPVANFSEGIGGSSAAVPDDWFVVMTDVVSSTRAIEEGKYKTVNIAGALPIIAIAREYGTLRRPFVFGGDGMTFLVDPEHIGAVRLVLSRVIRDIGEIYGLEIRAAVIPMRRLLMEYAAIRVTKVRISDQYFQAFLVGSGVQLAEGILKNPGGEEAAYAVAAAHDWEPVNYDGFTCRWADVPSPTGITAAIIVEPRGNENPLAVLKDIEPILGSDEEHHPLRVENMRMGGRMSTWKAPALVASGGKKNLRYYLAALLDGMMIAVTRLLYTLKVPLRFQIYEVWRVREQNIENSDFRKYEGALKMIVALDAAKLDELRSVLESARNAGRIYYGIHVSDRAHMTCIATVETGDDVHFVDASDGGYALAAKALKAQKS
jgi:hypothetical protein